MTKCLGMVKLTNVFNRGKYKYFVKNIRLSLGVQNMIIHLRQWMVGESKHNKTRLENGGQR